MRVLALWLAVALTACTSAPPPDPDALLGQGEYEWEDLSDADEVFVIQGPQGGFHILASVRTKGIEAGNPDDLLDPSNPETNFSVVSAGVDLILTGQYLQGIAQAPEDADPWTHEMVGRFAILDIDNDDVLDGVEITLSVSVVDADGIEVRDSRTLTATPHWANE